MAPHRALDSVRAAFGMNVAGRRGRRGVLFDLGSTFSA